MITAPPPPRGTPSLLAGAATLDAHDVTVVFGGRAVVDRVTLAVARGECVALVGESGAGKTTLLRCFNRMVIPDGGKVLVGGTDVARLPAVALRRHVGYVPQHGGLLPHWRVLRNVALVPTLLGADAPDVAATRALELVGLPPREFGDRFPHELSGGQRQRVALARAIAARPGIILMDEPFGALDAISRAEVRTAFAGLRGELGTTTLIVTHDLIEASLLAGSIAVMRGGRMEQQGSFEALLDAPANDYVANLLQRALSGTRTRG